MGNGRKIQRELKKKMASMEYDVLVDKALKRGVQSLSKEEIRVFMLYLAEEQKEINEKS